MRHLIPVIIAACALYAGACCKRQACGTDTPTLTVAKLAAKPAAFLDLSVVVIGSLNNAGSNYFTDLRLELSDGGAAIAVRPWLPREAPPPRPGGPRLRPAVLSNYLGQTVKLTGRLLKDGDTVSFAVEQAEIIAQEGTK